MWLGESKLTRGRGLQPSAAELKEIVGSYSDKKEIKTVQSEGFYVGGTRYVTIKADDRSLYGKQVTPSLVLSAGQRPV